MAARAEDAAATGRVVTARFPYREVAAIVGVVLATTGALIAGMQWAISTNVEPLHMTTLNTQTEVRAIRRDIVVLQAQSADLRAEVGENRAEIAENRRQIVDLRERMAKVETGLEQVQANQVRMLEILERRPDPRE